MNQLLESYAAFELKPAGFWVRFWAYLADLLITAALAGLLIRPLFMLTGWGGDAASWYAPVGILSSLLFYAYFVLTTKFLGQTAGKMIFGLRVVRLDDQPLDWGTVLFREWIGRFFSAVIWPLYWIVGFTPKKQGIHDFIADTTVVHENAYRKSRDPERLAEGPQLHGTGAV
ncbi:RDD family protein [Indiicoccus explosivorum]|uniref:RDD family protein n=1 Tax=Indiicoccus explosivorum TaxID=1917864 RepID=UPI000B4362CF|nr:RDD family protein [Indiicoccus explosivorum]